MMTIDLDDLEHDALAELGNIGVARASTALSRMLGAAVRISVPTVEIVPSGRVVQVLEAALPERLVAVSEGLSGAFRGTAILLVPAHRSLSLASAALPPEVPKEQAAELEGEALAEVGNIVLNSCLSVMANLLGTGITTTLPAVHCGSAAEILEASGLDSGPLAASILFHISFDAQPQDVAGQIVLALDSGSAAGLKAALGTYIGRVLRRTHPGAGAP